MRQVGGFRFTVPDLVALRSAQAQEGGVDVDGARVVYVRNPAVGRVRGRVVLIPGFTANHEDFNGLAGLLSADGWDVVSLSQRGQTPSTGPERISGYSVGTLARDVIAVLDDVGWPTAHVLGHSFAGLVAIELGIVYAERIRSLVLWNSGPFRSADGFPIHLDDLVERGPQALVDERLPGSDDVPLLRWYADRIRGTRPAQLEFALRAMLEQKDRTAQLARRHLPVLVAHGEHDAAWPQRTQRAMAARLHADYAVVADAGHCAHWDRPRYCARLLAAFWEDQQ